MRLLLLLLSIQCLYAQTRVIDSLLQIASNHIGDTVEIKALDGLVFEFKRRDIARSKTYVHQQIALAKSLGTTFGLASAYSGLVSMHQGEGSMDSALYYLTQLKDLTKDPKNKKAVINYASASGLFYKNQGKYKEALPYLLEALRLVGPDGDKTSRAGQMLNVGNAYYSLGDLRNAAHYHLQSLALFEEVKNKRGQSFSLQNLGNDFFDLEQYTVAEKYLLQSEKLKNELGDKRGVLTSWMTLGGVYQQTNKFDLSASYFNKALARAREFKSVMEESQALFNLGSLLKTMKKTEESRERFSEALILARQLGDSVLTSRINTYLVLLQNDAQKETKEEITLLRNIDISLEKGALPNTMEGYFELAEWYASRRQFEKAFEKLQAGQHLKDSIIGNEVIVQLKKLEEEYKNDKNEKEIALLKKDQELQTLAVSRQKVVMVAVIIAFFSLAAIGALLINRYRVLNRARRQIEMEQMRNSIARDLHDDIGSTLSSINILSKVALHEKNKNIENYLQLIGDQSSRIMENMGDMVWSINPKNDSLDQVIIRMREFANEILEPLNIDYHFSENIKTVVGLDADKRKGLFLIYKESVNNAAKYSEGKRIEISIHQTDSTLQLSVKDDGKGFDEQTIKAGNGLHNLRERAKEMNAVITIDSTIGKGTEVTLTLPLA